MSLCPCMHVLQAAVLEEFSDAVILRPSYMVGIEDKILNPLRTVVKNFPRIPLIEGGKAKLQLVNVIDVAKAVEVAALSAHKLKSIQGKVRKAGSDYNAICIDIGIFIRGFWLLWWRRRRRTSDSRSRRP